MKQNVLLKHEEIKELYSEIYNSFYGRYRLKKQVVRTEDEWNEIFQAAVILQNKYKNKMANSMLDSFIDLWKNQEIAIKTNGYIDL